MFLKHCPFLLTSMFSLLNCQVDLSEHDDDQSAAHHDEGDETRTLTCSSPNNRMFFVQ